MTTPPEPVELIRSAQQLAVGSEWIATQRLAVRRQIVSQTVQVAVTIRREELVIDRLTVDADARQPAAAGVALVFVLREEVPVVTVATRPYERVTVSVVQVAGEQTLTASLDSEQIELSH